MSYQMGKSKTNEKNNHFKVTLKFCFKKNLGSQVTFNFFWVWIHITKENIHMSQCFQLL